MSTQGESIPETPPPKKKKIIKIKIKNEMVDYKIILSMEKTSGNCKEPEAIWFKVTGPPREFMMSAMPSSIAHFNAIDSAKPNMSCHTSTWPLSNVSSSNDPILSASTC